MSCSLATVSAGIGVSCIHVFTTAQVAAAVTASGHAAEIQSLASEFPRTPSMAAVQGAGVGAGNWMVSGAASGPGGVGTGGHSTSAGAANGMGSMAGVSGTGMSGAGGHPSNTLGKRSASSRYFGNQQFFLGGRGNSTCLILPVFPPYCRLQGQLQQRSATPAPTADSFVKDYTKKRWLILALLSSEIEGLVVYENPLETRDGLVSMLQNRLFGSGAASAAQGNVGKQVTFAVTKHYISLS